MPKTKKPSGPVNWQGKPRMTLSEAREGALCQCEGCHACNGMEGYPCGQGGILGPLCRWCGEYQ